MDQFQPETVLLVEKKPLVHIHVHAVLDSSTSYVGGLREKKATEAVWFVLHVTFHREEKYVAR